MKVGIIGAGAWGTALAICSSKSGNEVIIWSYDGKTAEFEVPSDIKITTDMQDIGDMDVWAVVTPAAFFRKTVRKSRLFHKNQPIIICTKGIEPNSHKLMSEILTEELPNFSEYGVLSGPQFATEVAKGVKTGTTLAGTDTVLRMGHQLFGKFYLEDSHDVIGAEICGVGKNAVALISGYTSIAGGGENEKALVFTRAWNEVVQFGLANGAKMETFLGLCGIGDLFLTATSTTSRNFSAGVAIAQKKQVTGTVEGISALAGIIKRAHDLQLETPILSEMASKLNP